MSVALNVDFFTAVQIFLNVLLLRATCRRIRRGSSLSSVRIVILRSPPSGFSGGRRRIYVMREKKGYVYILTNTNNTVLYTGVTNNLAKRVYEHKNKEVRGFTERYNLHKLIYYEIFEDIVNAIIREKQIKGWLRSKKISLIEKVNPYWDDLYLLIV